MRLLLDTHVWLWSLLEPQRLSAEATQTLEDPGNELWLSPISVWEVLLLAERGRLQVGQEPSGWVRRALAAMPLRDAPLSREVALVSRSVALDHQDPADRFIAASAIVHGLTLVTGDARLLDSAEYEVLG